MKKIFLVLLISLITISASFALSDNLTVEDVNVDDLNLTNDTNIYDVSKDVKSDSKKVFNHSTLLYEDYLKGFEGFIADLGDVEYAMYYKNGNLVDGDSVKYNQSENLKDFDILLFSYKKDISNTYAFHTNSDLIDLDNSKVIPAYIVGDSIYVGQPKDDDNVTLKGYISLLNFRAGKITSANSNNQTNSSGVDNTTSFLDDQSPVLDQNGTGNVAENSSEVSNHNSVLETGGPVVALLVCLLVSIIAFRRKD